MARGENIPYLVTNLRRNKNKQEQKMELKLAVCFKSLRSGKKKKTQKQNLDYSASAIPKPGFRESKILLGGEGEISWATQFQPPRESFLLHGTLAVDLNILKENHLP